MRELDHKLVRWEVITEDGFVKVRPEHKSIPEALVNIGAANPFMSFATTAQHLAQQIVDEHNAGLKE